MKKIILTAITIILVGGAVFFFMNKNENNSSQEQVVIKKTYDISREYVALRYRTDNALLGAKDFASYDVWNQEISDIINKWELLGKDAKSLENSAAEMSEEKIGYDFFPTTLAYNKQEISDVFDKAPAGKKIKTLANFLGVDAKKAFQILKQDQAQVEADAWNEAGDTFQKLETSAVVIKDGCKVTGMVGGIILSGGTAAIASAGTAAQAAVVIAGADLTLEVGSDAARIGLGNSNKVSKLIDSARVVTEPLATIVTITSIPGNLSTGMKKFEAVMVALDQFNSAAQDGKIVGVQLPAYTPSKNKMPIQVAILAKDDLGAWLKDQGIKNDPETVASVEKILGLGQESSNNETTNNSNANEDIAEVNNSEKNLATTGNIESATGVWEGIMKFTPSEKADEQQVSFAFELRNDGTVGTTGEGKGFSSWKQEGSSVKLSIPTENSQGGYYDFTLSEDGNTLTFIKLAGPNSEGEWQEDFAGEDFFGGKFMQIELKKQ